MNIKSTCLLIAAIWVAAIVSPVVADAATHHSRVRPHVTHHRVINPDAGYAAFGMYNAPSYRFDPNSPAATGGGSLGYNQKLLIY